MEHVLEKMEEDSSSQVPSGGENSLSSSAAPAEERVKLYCLENPLSPEMDLRTVKNLMWKGPGDLVITYQLVK